MQGLIERKETIFYPDPSRIIARFLFTDNDRASNTIRTVLEMTEEDVSVTLKQTLRDYSMRHRNISKIYTSHFCLLEIKQHANQKASLRLRV